jgi:dTDP-4-amino-4,6-dideoxygalactose transaminase
MPDNIYVTRPHLPPLEEFLPYLEKIWASHQLTNAGPFHQELETVLARHLGVEHISLFTNGTLALMTALQTLEIEGEVITTPFSFVATTHSLVWNKLRPVFADIDPVSCNLDPAAVEAAITPKTAAILPVHCYGNPCDVEGMRRVAEKHGLKIIYDAAHAFGVKYKGSTVLRHGDLSVLSFHATKVYNTFEGGAIVSPDAATKQRVDFLKNFGFADEVTVMASGINGKMNEFQAALGLLQLKSLSNAFAARAAIDRRYRKELGSIPGISCLELRPDVEHNHAYFPIFVGNGYPISRDALYEHMRKHGIYARRYFYPLISDMPMYQGLGSARPELLQSAQTVAKAVLCLPIFPGLTDQQQSRVIDVIRAPGR